MTAAKKDILQGWKDIAAYVSRDVRTVKRWEKQRGLPVRRMPGDGRANVYALIPDLDSWLSSGGPVEPEAEAPIVDRTEVAPLQIVPQQSKVLKPNRTWIYATVAILCLAAVAAIALSIRTRKHDAAAADIPPFSPTQTVQMVKYSSRVQGVDALYLRGIYFYEQRTPETLERALRCFQEAIAKDPGYAPAYAGLAQAFNLVREYSMMPEDEAYAKAKTAAQHAIKLDPRLPEAHASLGFVEFFWDWDAPGAEREFHTAIALDPNSVLAHHWYASMLMHEGRFNESLAQYDLAQRLQPTSISIVSDRAFVLGLSGHRNEAADMLQEVITEDPHSASPHRVLAYLSLIEPTDIARYLDEMRRFATLRHDTHEIQVLDEIEPAFRAGGAIAMWHAILAEEERTHPGPNDRTYSMATAEAALGNIDASLRDLASLAARHDPSMIGIMMDSQLASVRKDPRFVPIAATLGVAISH